jgi:prepilin-type N-terminal cleavage/methylation domain-containing protein
MHRILPSPRSTGGFTLIELLIVVAIIAILAAIAVPNFLEAQTRARVARVQSDLRALATGLESYRVDQNKYPEGTDNPNNYDARIADLLGDRARGYYTLRTRTGTAQTAGRDFHTLTTPIAYVATFFTDPFASQASGILTYCYRPEKERGNGYILTSFGPDTDLFEDAGGKLGAGTLNAANPLSAASDSGSPARLGDINERAFVAFLEGDPAAQAAVAAFGGLQAALLDLSYDPTNGTVSDGDILRVGP